MQRLNAKEDIQLVDVREPWEHRAYNIGGTLIPLNTLFENIALIDTHRMVVLYCRKGVRSLIAIQRLQQKFGFSKLVNLEGGMEAWIRQTETKSSDINRIIE